MRKSRAEILKEMGLKIIYSNHYFDPNIPSGGNRKVKELCKRFAVEFGDGFEVITARNKPIPNIGNVVTHEISYEPKSLMSKYRAMKQIGNIMKKSSPAIFINESVPIPFHSLARHIHFQAVWDLRYFTSNLPFFYRLKYTIPLKRQWQKSKYLVTCSDFSRSELYKYCHRNASDIIVNYFGVDEKLFDVALSPAPVKDIDILYVGHFETRKNHINLIKALSLVGKNLRVELIGVDNGLKVELETLAKTLGLTNTHFFTLNGDDKLWDYYRRAKLFVFPSHYEGFGMPLIEALALGIPVAASDIPVFREIGGTLVDYFNQNNPDDIAKVIKSNLDNPRTPSVEDVRAGLYPFFWDNVYTKFVDDLIDFAKK